MASSLGNAMAFTPAFMDRMSVSLRCFPFGRMHPKTRGVSGNIVRAVAVTLAMSVGVGGFVLDMAVPWMGIKEIITMAEGLYGAIMLRAVSSPLSSPLCKPTMTCGTKSIFASCRAFRDLA